ncbi:MAG: FAD-dependent oxidoreductase [Pseudomonadota bacterium]
MRCDAVIIGGGLAGAATAISAARAGLQATVLEREAIPKHKVCGEFLSVSTIEALRALGVCPLQLGAVPLDRVRVSAGGAPVEAILPFRAVSLSRKTLDAAMLDAAAEAGAVVRRGVRVRDAGQAPPTAARAGRWHIDASCGALNTDRLVIATGKTDLRGHARPSGVHGAMVGLKRLVVPARTPEPVIDLALFPGGYAGIQPIEDGRLNVCLAVTRAHVRRHGVDGAFASAACAAPHLSATLGALAGETHATANIPYGMVRKAHPSRPHYVGDQAAVIASILGEGMAIALTTGADLGAQLADPDKARAALRKATAAARHRVRLSGVLSHLACSGPGAATLMSAARLQPGLVRLAASLSRLPPHTRETGIDAPHR